MNYYYSFGALGFLGLQEFSEIGASEFPVEGLNALNSGREPIYRPYDLVIMENF